MPSPVAIADDVVIYLHIGQMKTGTTALQHTLVRERKALLEHGVLYPKTGPVPKHSEIVWSLLTPQKPKGWSARRHGRKNIDEVIAKLENEIVESGAKKALISCEEISLYEPHIFAKMLDRWKHHLRVIVYLRPQIEMLESQYKFQVFQHRLKVKFDKFCHRRMTNDTRLRRTLDFDKFLTAWEDFVGQGNMRVSLFEGDARADLWGDFTCLLGLDIPLGSPMQRENVSISGSYLEFLRRTNDYVPASVGVKLAEDVKWLAANSPESPFPLWSDGLRRSVLERYAESNRRVAQRYFARENLFQTLSP